MNSATRNLAFGHTAGVGKDTLAALVIERGDHYRRALADAVKEELGCALLSLDPRIDGNRVKAYEFVDSRKHLPAMRKMLQAYGDGKREMIAKTYWIDQVFGYTKLCREHETRSVAWTPSLPIRERGVIVPDLRYRNEVQVFLEHEFVCIDIDRPDAPKLPGDLSAHVSETQLRPEDFPYQLINDGTPGEMLSLFDAVVRYHATHGMLPRAKWPLRFWWERAGEMLIAIYYAPPFVRP